MAENNDYKKMVFVGENVSPPRGIDLLQRLILVIGWGSDIWYWMLLA